MWGGGGGGAGGGGGVQHLAEVSTVASIATQPVDFLRLARV